MPATRGNGNTRRRARRPGTVALATVEEPITARDRAVRKRDKEAEVNAAAAEEVPLNFAICRSLQHGWQHVLEPERGHNEVGFASVCASCSTKRVKWINDRTGAVRNTYEYSAGYKLRTGEVKLQPFEWRKNLLRRL